MTFSFPVKLFRVINFCIATITGTAYVSCVIRSPTDCLNLRHIQLVIRL